MRDIELFAKTALEASVKIGIPAALGGVAESVAKPEFATAVGLAMFAAESEDLTPAPSKKSKKSKSTSKKGFFKKIFGKF